MRGLLAIGDRSRTAHTHLHTHKYSTHHTLGVQASLQTCKGVWRRNVVYTHIIHPLYSRHVGVIAEMRGRLAIGAGQHTHIFTRRNLISISNMWVHFFFPTIFFWGAYCMYVSVKYFAINLISLSNTWCVSHFFCGFCLDLFGAYVCVYVSGK